MAERTCQTCGAPLKEDAHFNTEYCATCAAARQRVASRRYYRLHAEKLRKQRTRKYAAQKANLLPTDNGEPVADA